jgi:hypothetical protein
MLVSIVMAAVISTPQMQGALWIPADARPEAVLTGGALLMLAGALREFTHRSAK